MTDQIEERIDGLYAGELDRFTPDRDALAKAGTKEQAVAAYRRAFAASREVPQAQDLARRLKEAGSPVSLAEHFGFLTD